MAMELKIGTPISPAILLTLSLKIDYLVELLLIFTNSDFILNCFGVLDVHNDDKRAVKFKEFQTISDNIPISGGEMTLAHISNVSD